jgi:hypothetical protein
MSEIQLAYDSAKRCATLTFPNGRQLRVAGVTEEQAKAFRDKHGAEFQKRDCCLHTIDGQFTREQSHGE